MSRDNVVVTGAAGRLGKYVVRELRLTYDVTAVDRSGPEPIDILDLGSLRSVFRGKSAVIHLAGIDAHVQAKPEQYFQTNVLGTWNVLQAACEAGIRKAVVCSSSSATGLNASNPTQLPHYLPIDEDHPLLPVEAYGLGKQLNEITAASFARKREMHVVCIRPTYVAFPELVPHLASCLSYKPEPSLETNLPLAMSEPPPLLRTYVDPADLAQCFRLGLEYRSSGFDLFFASAADTFEPEPTLHYIRRIYGVLPEVRKPALYSENPNASPIDSSRAEQILGWRPRTVWAQLLRSAFPNGPPQR